MCDVFKDCRKTFDKNCDKNRWAVDELFEHYLVKIVHKNKNRACCNENNMGLEVKVASCIKDKGKKTCFRWNAFMIDCISTYKSQMALMGLDFEADKPRMNAEELRVMMAEL